MRHIFCEPEGTLAFAVELGACLLPGDFLALNGEMGAGKTLMAEGIARGCGCGAHVASSPTFVLMQVYQGARFPLYHFDLYRIADPGELDGLDIREYFYGDGVCLVEWPRIAAHLLPPDRLNIALAYHEQGREITLTATGPRHAHILDMMEGRVQ